MAALYHHAYGVRATSISGVTFLIFQMAGVMRALIGSISVSYQKKIGKRKTPMTSVAMGWARSLKVGIIDQTPGVTNRKKSAERTSLLPQSRQ